MRDLKVLVSWTVRHWAPVALTLGLQLAATLSLGAGIALLVPAAAALFGAPDAVIPPVLQAILPEDRGPWIWLMAVIGLIVARNALVALSALTTARCVHDLMLDLRSMTAHQILHLPIPTLDSVGIGDLTQRANGEVHRVAQAAKALIRILAQSGVVAVLTLFMLLLSWRLSLLILGAVGLLLPVWRWIGSSAEESGRRLSTASRRYARALQEVLWSLRVVRDVGGEERERERLAAHAQEREHSALKASVVSSLVAPLTETSIVVGVALILGVASLTSESDASPSEIATVVTVLALLSRWLPAAAGVAAAWGQLSEHLGAVRSVSEFLRWPQAHSGGIVSLESSTRLQLHGVSYRYPEAAELALDQVDLTVARGEIVAVVGASGAGKSTLASLIAGHLEPTKGRITFEGYPLRELDRPSQRQLVHVLPQDAIVFDGSIADNVTYPGSAGPADEIERAARAAGLTGLSDRLDLSLDSLVGERGSKLSGGERQRVALARAFYRAPSFLVMDESTSAVDEATEREIARFLRQTRSRWGCLVIAHRPTSVQIADRIVVLRAGRVVGDGNHDQLVSECSEYRRLYLESEIPSSAGPGAAVNAADR